jgi:TPR repeat protein
VFVVKKLIFRLLAACLLIVPMALLAQTPTPFDDLAKAKAAEKIKDYQTASQGFFKAAIAGNAEAERRLALLYGSGNGVPKDVSKYLEWMRKASKFGDLDAMAWLGFSYEAGWGVSKDCVVALHCYQNAADMGRWVRILLPCCSQ